MFMLKMLFNLRTKSSQGVLPPTRTDFASATPRHSELLQNIKKHRTHKTMPLSAIIAVNPNVIHIFPMITNSSETLRLAFYSKNKNKIMLVDTSAKISQTNFNLKEIPINTLLFSPISVEDYTNLRLSSQLQEEYQPIKELEEEQKTVIKQSDGIMNISIQELERLRDEITNHFSGSNYETIATPLFENKIDQLIRSLESLHFSNNHDFSVQHIIGNCKNHLNCLKIILDGITEENSHATLILNRFVKNAEQFLNIFLGMYPELSIQEKEIGEKIKKQGFDFAHSRKNLKKIALEEMEKTTAPETTTPNRDILIIEKQNSVSLMGSVNEDNEHTQFKPL